MIASNFIIGLIVFTLLMPVIEWLCDSSDKLNLDEERRLTESRRLENK